MTPSQARNAIKKSLKALIDPTPKNNEKILIWSYFNDSCVYCGQGLLKESRKGHIDHLYSEMAGGANKLSNLVLTCSTCNDDEKRESNWLDFLKVKCGIDDKTFIDRKARIENWININGGDPFLSVEENNLLAGEFEKINKVFSVAVENLRRTKM